MDSVSEASKVGDMLCARFFREIRFAQRVERRFPAKPPAGPILHTRKARKYLCERNRIYPCQIRETYQFFVKIAISKYDFCIKIVINKK